MSKNQKTEFRGQKSPAETQEFVETQEPVKTQKRVKIPNKSKRSIKGAYSFETRVKCVFCGSLKTNATSTQGQWQYRKCVDCGRRSSVKGRKVD